MAYNLKNQLWQNGAHDWWAMIDGEDHYLGGREFPLPPEEGDEWVVRSTGDRFCIRGHEIIFLGKGEPEVYEWL